MLKKVFSFYKQPSLQSLFGFLTKKLQKIPIIAQTAYTMGVEKESALAAGCIGYLSKPINAAELLKAIDNVFSDASITD